MNKKEIEKTKNIISVLDKRIVAVDHGRRKSNGHDVLGQNRSKEKRYAFDFAFGPDTSTRTVYNHTTRFLIDGVVIGYNATVFAYGATGAGKTFTMLGKE